MINLFGLPGAIITNVFAALISLVLYFKAISRKISINIPITYFAKISVIVICALFVSRVVRLANLPVIYFMLLGVSYSLVFLGVVIGLRLVDINFVKQIVFILLKKKRLVNNISDPKSAIYP